MAGMFGFALVQCQQNNLKNSIQTCCSEVIQPTNFSMCFILSFTLETEISSLYSYIIKFMKDKDPNVCWPQMFRLSDKLIIPNILQLIEICITIPISNNEVERIFLSFHKMMTRDR